MTRVRVVCGCDVQVGDVIDYDGGFVVAAFESVSEATRAVVGSARRAVDPRGRGMTLPDGDFVRLLDWGR